MKSEVVEMRQMQERSTGSAFLWKRLVSSKGLKITLGIPLFLIIFLYLILTLCT